ncbi:MAG: DUF5696 domain-containing protein [Treponema sp.]|jgi:hypothetical protein|nr:DUF5696 domain-containing protein [Treponema sp.]
MLEKIDALITSFGNVLASFFRTKAVLKLLAVIIAFSALVSFIRWLPTLQVRRGKLPERIRPVPAASLGEIAKDAALFLAAENGGKKMYLDPQTLNIRIQDSETGFEWNGLRAEEGTPDDRSVFKIGFLSEDNMTTWWNSYTYSQKDGNYTIEKIRNGVRINFQIGNADPTDINAFMPRRISIPRYENVFLDGLDGKVREGAITGEEAGRYKSVLGMLFAKDEEKGWYYNKLASSPPGSATRQMLSMVRLLGYTVEDLVKDEAPYDLPEEERRPPVGFFIPLEFTLEEGDFLTRVSTEHIVVQNDYYTLIRLIPLPNFGAVSAEEAPSGYIFVPDGSGALISLNSFDSNYNGYERPLYYNTVFRDKESMPPFPEDLHMPVFGMLYDGAGGFLGVIEKGGETALIGARAGSPKPGAGGDMYNSVYSGFDTAQYKQMNIVGAASNGGSYAVGAGMLMMDFTVRYKLFGNPVSYFDLASAYRRYLSEKYGLKPEQPDQPEIYLDVTGALKIEGRFLGKSYERVISMTEYAELADIIKDLRDGLPGVPLTAAYSGVFNGGIDNSLSNRAVLVSQNGPPAALTTLFETAKNSGTDLFMGANIARIYKPGGGYSARIHAAQGYDGEPAYFWSYDLPSGKRKPLSWYTLLNPLYLENVVEGFLADVRNYDKLYINDLGVDYYAGYKRNAVVPPLAALVAVNNALTRLGEEKTLALNNPSMDKLPFTKWAVNISRESSNYGGFFTSIPFRQLVMNGLVRYTTLDANMSGGDMDYFLLAALETGSAIKFHITAKNADALKYTEHTEFLSTGYEARKDDIKEIVRRWQEAFCRINSMEIVNHETLADKVYRTTYGNGVSVTVNYNSFAVGREEGGTIPPLGYVIDGGE